MRHHRSAIFSGAVALVSFFAIGTGASASAAPTYGAGSNPSTADCRRAPPATSVGNLTTLHAATASVNGRSQSILVDAKGLPLYYFQGDTAKKSNVSGALLRLWPALVSAHPVGTGTPGKLTALAVRQRPSGDLQRTLSLHLHRRHPRTRDGPRCEWLLRRHAAPQVHQWLDHNCPGCQQFGDSWLRLLGRTPLTDRQPRLQPHSSRTRSSRGRRSGLYRPGTQRWLAAFVAVPASSPFRRSLFSW